jgi:hypothetical protein
MDEELQENGIIGRIYPPPAVDPRFHVPHDDQKEPPESKAHMHIAEKRILLEHLAMKQGFEENFP